MTFNPQHHHSELPRQVTASKMSELSEAYIASGLFHFILSFSGIFVPLYLLNDIGFSLIEILIFLAVISAGRALFAYPAGLLVSKMGPKHSMIASYPIAFLIYLFLYLLPETQWLIFPILILEGILTSLYPLAFHVQMSKSSHEASRGRELSKLFVIDLAALALGPILGGLVIDRFGFPALLVLAMVMFVFASFPLLLTPEIYKKRKFELKNLKLAEIQNDFFAQIFINIERVVSTTVWTIFIFLFLNNYALVGGTRSLQVGIAAVVAVFVGKMSDKVDRKKLLSAGSYLLSIIEFVRLFARSIPAIFGIDFLRGVALPLKDVPYLSRLYKHADEQPRMEYVYWMEVAGGAGLTIVFAATAIIALYFGTNTALLFCLALAPLSALGFRVMR